MDKLTKFMVDNKLISKGAVEHAQQFLDSKYRVNEEFENIPEILLLLRETYDGLLVKSHTSMVGVKEYTSLADYVPELVCAQLVPIELQIETQCTLLKVDDINRRIVLGAATTKSINIEKIRSLVSNRKPGHEIIIYKVFNVSYHRWMIALCSLIQFPYQDKVVKVPTDETMKTIFRNALELGATDISFEPYEQSMEVWFIVGKMWHKFPFIEFVGKDDIDSCKNWLMTASNVASSSISQPLVNSALPSLADYDTHRGRLSKLEANFGPAINIRILPKKPEFIDIKKLNYTDVVEAYLHDISYFRTGIIVMSGETNSGKNTGIFGILSENTSRSRHKVVSIENPIEYLVPRVIQVEAHSRTAYEQFAEALIRQSPDIAYFSEISNGFILEHVMATAITGKMVFTTIHAKDCANFFNRVNDLSKSNITAQLSSYLIGVINQKLVPKACPDCKVSKTMESVPARYREVLMEYNYTGDLFENTGKMDDGKTLCPTCLGTKCKGIVPVAEYLDFDEDMAFNIRYAENEAEVHTAIQKQLKEKGISMMDDGLRVMARGDVTMDILIDRNILDFKKRGLR